MSVKVHPRPSGEGGSAWPQRAGGSSSWLQLPQLLPPPVPTPDDDSGDDEDSDSDTLKTPGSLGSGRGRDGSFRSFSSAIDGLFGMCDASTKSSPSARWSTQQQTAHSPSARKSQREHHIGYPHSKRQTVYDQNVPVRRNSTEVGDATAEDAGFHTEAMLSAVKRAEKIVKKKKTRGDLGSEWTTCRRRAHRVTDHHATKLIIAVVIFLNAIHVGLETDSTVYHDRYETSVDMIFIFIFTLEVTLHMYVERLQFFTQGWNILDLVLVGLACVDAFFLHLMDGDVGAFTVVRIMRVMRLARVVRLFRACKEFWLFVSGTMGALRCLLWALPIGLLIFFMFAIFCSRFFGMQEETDEEMYAYFGSILRSMFTLFQCMTTEGWGDIARRTMVYERWAAIFFILFMFLTTFAMTSVFVAVIVENAFSTALKDTQDLTKENEKERMKACHNILRIFDEADTDKNREVSASEFKAALKKTSVKKWMLKVGLDVRKAEVLFDILDYDNSGHLDLDEFGEGVMRARGGASAQDILAVHCDLYRAQHKVARRLEEVQKEIAELHTETQEQFKDFQMLLRKDMHKKRRASELPKVTDSLSNARKRALGSGSAYGYNRRASEELTVGRELTAPLQRCPSLD